MTKKNSVQRVRRPSLYYVISDGAVQSFEKKGAATEAVLGLPSDCVVIKGRELAVVSSARVTLVEKE